MSFQATPQWRFLYPFCWRCAQVFSLPTLASTNHERNRDLKPENILLDHTHRFIKITDFGVATVFRTQWEQAPHLVHGIAGSAPYIAPEEWKQDQAYLPTKVDIWACGMIG